MKYNTSITVIFCQDNWNLVIYIFQYLMIFKLAHIEALFEYSCLLQCGMVFVLNFRDLDI